MREIAQFRIREKCAHLLFSENEGRKVSHSGLPASVRAVKLSTGDPKYTEIGKLQRQFNTMGPLELLEGNYFFSSWDIRRTYTASEIEDASLFHLIVTKEFAPCGEECGTLYDEATACPECGSGATQTSPLYLDESKIPRNTDFAYTIADCEVIVSGRAKEILARENVSGVEFAPIVSKNKHHRVLGDWFQLVITAPKTDLIAPTQYGNDPFDYDEVGQHRCLRGDLAGLNVLSELFVQPSGSSVYDFTLTSQYIGQRRRKIQHPVGLLRPFHLMIVSRKVRRLIASNKLLGCRFEIVREREQQA